MVPFLDPGSRFFEEPARHGYRIHHRTLQEHRDAMVAPLWHQRLNYDTKWMSRRQLQDVTYEAIRRLVEVKGELGVLPRSFAQVILDSITATEALLAEMEQAIELDGELSRELRDAIRAYNRTILAASSDQILPMPRPFGGRWFDDVTVPPDMIESLCSSSAP
jgi:clorobiocin biosynthesis protein CloN6